MRVHGIAVSRSGDTQRIEVQAGDKLLTFAVDGAERLGDINSAVLVAVLYPAMCLGTAVSMPDDARVSSLLLRNLDKLQEIREQWYPKAQGVEVSAGTHAIQAGTENVGMLFSGGVDAMYSFVENEAAITDLIFCIGLDIQLDEKARLESAVRFGQQFAAARGKQFVTIDTNAGNLWRPIPFGPHHGQFYSAMAVMLGCRTGIIAASYPYHSLRPWGSHPLTDELIATEWTTTVHHGPVDRHVKLRRIAEDADCMAMLRVCNASPEYNCGKCEKCLRTMLPLQLMGKSAPTLPGTVTPADIRGIKLFTDAKAEFWLDNLVVAQQAGDQKFIAAIKAILLNYNRRKLAKGLIRTLRGRL